MSRSASVAGLLVACVLVVVLAFQNRTLRADQEALLDRVTEPYAGMWVPAVGRAALDGTPLVVGEPGAGRAQVLLFFTTTCRYCKESLPAWRTLAARLGQAGAGVQVLGVSTDSLEATRRYAREHRLPFPVVRLAEPRWMGLYRARAVPLVTVVNASGRVTYARLGALDGPAAVDSVVGAARAAR